MVHLSRTVREQWRSECKRWWWRCLCKDLAFFACILVQRLTQCASCLKDRREVIFHPIRTKFAQPEDSSTPCTMRNFRYRPMIGSRAVNVQRWPKRNCALRRRRFFRHISGTVWDIFDLKTDSERSRRALQALAPPLCRSSIGLISIRFNSFSSLSFYSH